MLKKTVTYEQNMSICRHADKFWEAMGHENVAWRPPMTQSLKIGWHNTTTFDRMAITEVTWWEAAFVQTLTV